MPIRFPHGRIAFNVDDVSEHIDVFTDIKPSVIKKLLSSKDSGTSIGNLIQFVFNNDRFYNFSSVFMLDKKTFAILSSFEISEKTNRPTKTWRRASRELVASRMFAIITILFNRLYDRFQSRCNGSFPDADLVELAAELRFCVTTCETLTVKQQIAIVETAMASRLVVMQNGKPINPVKIDVDNSHLFE